MSAYACCSDVPFNNIVKFMQKCSEVRNKDKEKQFQHFLEKNVPRKVQDIFQIFRLLLPAEDLDRRSYGAKEDRLAKLLVQAAGLSSDSADAKHALNWKRSGRHAGQFPEMMEQYVLRNACRADGADVVKKITVSQINEYLDKLALAANDNHQQVKILGDLMGHCSSQQMKWITRIVVKDLKIGMSKERMLRIFHPDATELLNITSDLKRVCIELADPAARMARKDVEPGCCVKAQLCGRANSVEDCYAKMKGQPFTVEVKFDGNRLQIHRSSDSVYYFSRRGREHGGMSDFDVFDQVVQEQVLSPKVILDGEMVVWNKTRGVFEAFGGIRSTMIAAKEGVPKDEMIRMTDRGADYSADPDYVHPTAGDIELVYIAFDLLFVGEESVITRPLHERQQMLAQVIKCIPADKPGIPCGAGTINGRLIALIPDQPVSLPITENAAVDSAGDAAEGAAAAAATGGGGGQGDRDDIVSGSAPAVSCAAPQELVFSRIGRSLADVQAMYDMALSRQEEGIIVKQLNSPWKPDDRSNTWLKMKPDYVTNAEIDAVIIGVYMGQSRRAGQVSEFLLGLTEGGGVGWGPEAVKWCSFCRVGTGMKDSERQQLHERLLPVLVPAGPGTKPPRCYRVSGREKPDFWVSDPQRSVVVEVKSDIRTITSKMYAADYSLRFPRVTKLCWDRSALDITSYAQLERDVAENKGMITSMRLNMQMGVGIGPGGKRMKRSTPRKNTAANRGGRQLVVAAAQLPDVSGVSQIDDLLAGKKVAFLNYCSPTASTAEKTAAKQMYAEMVARHGGTQQVMKGPETDYVFADHLTESDIAALARKESTQPRAVHDVISTAWLKQVDQAGELLPIMPRHRLYLTYQGRLALAGGADEFADFDNFGNTYLHDVGADDVAALVTRLIPNNELARYQQQLEAGQQQLQQQLEAADTLAVAPAETIVEDKTLAIADPNPNPDTGGVGTQGGLGDRDSPTAPDMPRTAQSVMLELQHELQMQTGWRDNRATLFAGCCLLFVPYEVSPPGAAAGSSAIRNLGQMSNHQITAAPAAAATAGIGNGADSRDLVLLDGVKSAQAAAAAFAAAVAKQQLADLKLAVLLHGGSVVETYSSRVTHIVLWPIGPVQQQRQQQWLLQQQQRQDQGLHGHNHQTLDHNGPDHNQSNNLMWPWCEVLMTGPNLQISGQQLVSMLAAAATTAADADAAAAAAAAAARVGKNGSSSGYVLARGQQRHRRAKVAPPPAAAAGGLPASEAAAAGSSAGSLAAPAQAAAAAGGAAGGIKALSARLAAGQSHVMEHVLDQQQEAPAVAQLSPGALKHLRLLRRRLLAAQMTTEDNNKDDNPAGANPVGSGSRKARKRWKRLALPDLYLVNPCWVTDSLSQVSNVLNNGPSSENNTVNNTLAYSLIQRCSEILYAPVVQQQQQQGGDEQAATAAAAVGASADVASWPWQDYGLGPAGGSSSSSASSDGSGSDATPQKRKRARSKSASATATQQATPTSRPSKRRTGAAAAAEGPEGQETAAAGVSKAKRRRGAAAAADTAEELSQQQQQQQIRQQQRRGRGGRGRGRGRGRRAAQKSESSETDHEAEMSESESAEGSHTQSETESDRSHSQVGTRSNHPAAAAAGGGGFKVEPCAADSQQEQRSQRRVGRRGRGRGRKGAAAAAEQQEGPAEPAARRPGWLFSQDQEEQRRDEEPQWQQHQDSGDQHAQTAMQAQPAAAAAVPLGPPTRRLPSRLNRSNSSVLRQGQQSQQQQQQQDEPELEIAETPDLGQPLLLPFGSLRRSGSSQQQQQQGQQTALVGNASKAGPPAPAAPAPAAATASTAAASTAAARTAAGSGSSRVRSMLDRIWGDDDAPLAAAAAAPSAAARARAPAGDTSPASTAAIAAVRPAVSPAVSGGAVSGGASRRPSQGGGDSDSDTKARQPLWQRWGLFGDDISTQKPAGSVKVQPGGNSETKQAATTSRQLAGAGIELAVGTAPAARDSSAAAEEGQQKGSRIGIRGSQPTSSPAAGGRKLPASRAAGVGAAPAAAGAPVDPKRPAPQQQLSHQDPGAKPKRSLLKLKAELDRRRTSGTGSDG